ncbi:MAG: hypothetical protein GWN99_00515 [Gemmatimonadetes bacterium]|uniref:Uncharacterized protein n=1 Tax=Candidatus Kutchimonas denitrificans TaxID=3056748 RepID=A0AAE5CAR1_9BACT|nr:hypothetical protein [Gemmatimonadota bacterium]NIR73590.1 hypothetical protein [Candidatus Kutchimonas denitrificans]NIR99549.1 hypothetical protein [Gemmatimonadota bacterium]NIT65169.1 hypothetical protein [Gemmatimonadota bacterium]NIV23702.1 hypothetical protein [Gemmatimonadota bacterium]
MRHARRRSNPRKDRSAAARPPQFRTRSTGASTTIPSENGTAAARRLALLDAADGSTLQRLSETVREETSSNNGKGSCARLSAGDVACTCDYCEHFWSRLAERLRGSSEER